MMDRRIARSAVCEILTGAAGGDLGGESHAKTGDAGDSSHLVLQLFWWDLLEGGCEYDLEMSASLTLVKEDRRAC